MSKGPRLQEQELDLVVAEREELATGIVCIKLEDPDGQSLPGWTPGAHIDLLLGDDLVRQYSLCSSPGDLSHWRVGVLLDPASRGGSQYVHAELREGAAIKVRGPRNHFTLDDAPRYRFIAGGIGITPIIPMIEAAETGGTDWQLLYGGRERASMAFVEDLRQYGDKVTICPQDEEGMLDLDSVLADPDDEALVYCCGPGALLDAVEQKCASWRSGALRMERFSAKPAAESADDALEAFEVVCQRSGITINVSNGESILDKLNDAGISTLSSCGEGICGTCEAEVLEGTPDHRDSVLDDAEKAENDAMMICVSRSKSERLVLDL